MSTSFSLSFSVYKNTHGVLGRFPYLWKYVQFNEWFSERVNNEAT